MTPLTAVIGTALVWAVVFALFVWAVRSRWMARWERGFFLQVAIALTGIALMSASVVGVWGYQAAGQMLDNELVVEMQDIGAIVENQVAAELDDIQHQLKNLGKSLADARDRGASIADLKERLSSAQSLDAQYLQLRLYNANGEAVWPRIHDELRARRMSEDTIDAVFQRNASRVFAYARSHGCTPGSR